MDRLSIKPLRKLKKQTNMRRMYTQQLKQLNSLENTQSLMLRRLEKELKNSNIENCRLLIGTYSWLYDELAPVHDLLNKYSHNNKIEECLFS